MASSFENIIEQYIKESFHSYRYEKQYSVRYNNILLKFDFFIPDLKVFIEVQGSQHSEYNSFFYKDIYDFHQARKRDNYKHAWCGENGFTLVTLNEKEVNQLTAQQFKERIVESIYA